MIQVFLPIPEENHPYVKKTKKNMELAKKALLQS
jgi:hypothetical protein